MLDKVPERARQDAVVRIEKMAIKIVDILTEEMNALHKLSYPRSYWNTILGEFSFNLATRLVVDEYLDEAQILVRKVGSELLPNGSPESLDDAKDLLFCANLEVGDQTQKASELTSEVASRVLELSKKKGINVKRIDKVVSCRVIRGKNIHLYTAYINRFWSAYLCFFLGLSMKTLRVEFKEALPSEIHKWRGEVDYKVAANSERYLILRLVKKYLPKSYLEYFNLFVDMSQKIFGGSNYQIVLTDVGIYYDKEIMEMWKFWAAERRMQGAALYLLQHGGHYGFAKYCSNLSYEIQVSDRYFTWGWKNAEEKKTVPGPAFRLKARSRRLPLRSRDKILILGFDFPASYPWLNSHPQGLEVSKAFNRTLQMVEALRGSDFNITSKIRFRPYQIDYGNRFEKKFLKNFPEIEISDRESTFVQDLRAAKLVISTYNATTFLECLRMNIPSLMFFDLRDFPLTEENPTLIEALTHTNLLIDSPERCAQFLQANYRSIGTWWKSRETRGARKSFERKFADTRLATINRFVWQLRENPPIISRKIHKASGN